MPNSTNITRPITIVGNGRSGTSLVSQVFHAHPDCYFTGESINLIHSVWYSLAESLDPAMHGQIPAVIRGQFCQLFPSDQPHWMHKPIGLPIVAWFLRDDDEFGTWFWEVMDQVFPDARYLTVLRHPLDVIRSSHEWWGRRYDEIVYSNRRVAQLITHPRSRVDYAVRFRDLIDRPEAETRALLAHAGLDFHPECLHPFEIPHVASRPAGEVQGPTHQRDSFSHRERWSDIDPALLTPEYREAVEACWSRFGFDFGPWPI